MLKIKNSNGVFREPDAAFFRVGDTYKPVSTIYVNNEVLERNIYLQLSREFSDLIQCIQSEIDVELEYMNLTDVESEKLVCQQSIS